MDSEIQNINGKDTMVYYLETNTGVYGFRKLTMGEKIALKKKVAGNVKMKDSKTADIDISALFEIRYETILKTINQMPDFVGVPKKSDFETQGNPDDLEEIMAFVDELNEPKKK